ncbi:MAG: HD-GYP domain-containing protein [bacterium]
MTSRDGRTEASGLHMSEDETPEQIAQMAADTNSESHRGSTDHGAWQPGVHFRRALSKVNRELWLLLSMLALAFALNYLVTGHRMLLGFYTFPTLFAAYYYGRKHATLTAIASVFLVGFLARINPAVLSGGQEMANAGNRWHDIAAWGGVLVITAYAMGSLHEHHKARIQELMQTYRGLLLILRHFVSKDQYTENHSYRVSVYAAKIATYMGLSDNRIEDVRAASLIHDIGKLKTSRALLHKAARLASREFEEVRKHVDRGASMLEPVGGPLHRIIPIILAHHDKFDGTGYHEISGEEIPLEARIIAVADWYDSLTSDRPYRRAMSPFDAKEAIFRESGTEFDPEVVDAFIQAFRENEMEIPEVMV